MVQKESANMKDVPTVSFEVEFIHEGCTNYAQKGGVCIRKCTPTKDARTKQRKEELALDR